MTGARVSGRFCSSSFMWSHAMRAAVAVHEKKAPAVRGLIDKWVGRTGLAVAISRDAFDDQRRRGRTLLREAIGVLEILERLLELRLVVVMDHHQRFAL